MVWALAVTVALGVGLPIGAWAYTRLRPPPPPSGLGTAYDPIDKWLLRRHALAPSDREWLMPCSSTRTAVLADRRAAVGRRGRHGGDRRAALAGGPDVWEVVGRLQELDGPEEQRISLLAEESGLHPRLIRLALNYAAERPEEVLARIERNRAMAERNGAPLRVVPD